MTTMREELTEVMGARIDRDARKAASLIGRDEARYLVSLYYDIQKTRIAAGNQVAASRREERPIADTINVLGDGMLLIEKRIASTLEAYCKGNELGQWSLAVKGIGPVLAAGLMAHIDIEKANTAGSVWRFAGLDPTVVWGKGQKRPYNADLKTLCWKIGESFIKVSGNPDSKYGALYKQRKALEEERNIQGQNAQTAADILASTRAPGKTTDAYKQLILGRLPQAQVHARARRYATKMFLSHWHQTAYILHHHQSAPVPYALAHMDHVDMTQPEVPFPQV